MISGVMDFVKLIYLIDLLIFIFSSAHSSVTHLTKTKPYTKLQERLDKEIKIKTKENSTENR